MKTGGWTVILHEEAKYQEESRKFEHTPCSIENVVITIC
jgi:hypothetical protein